MGDVILIIHDSDERLDSLLDSQLSKRFSGRTAKFDVALSDVVLVIHDGNERLDSLLCSQLSKRFTGCQR